MNTTASYKQLVLVMAFLLFAILSCIDGNRSLSSASLQRDSIPIWIEASKTSQYTREERSSFLHKAYSALKLSKIDTLALKNLSAIAYQNYKLGDSLLFMQRNREVLELSKKLGGLYSSGDAHWNYASYYNDGERYDSAYYHFDLAYRFFDKGGYLYESAKVQYGMAFVKSRFKDHSGSEVLIFNIIPKFEKLRDYQSLYSCYDLLGQLQNDIYEYDQALEYYKASMSYANLVRDIPLLREGSLNNIGNTYLKKGNYTAAKAYFDRILSSHHLRDENALHYARVLSNRAYSQMLMGDTLGVVFHLKEALGIRDSLDSKEGVVASKIYLSQYYELIGDTMQAVNFVKEANLLAKEIKNGGDYLSTLQLLAKLESGDSGEYFRRYIRFRDSLEVRERRIQNKFARIAYETDGYIERAKRLSQQKIWISVVGLGVISILGLSYFLFIQKSKNQMLRLENEQQKANEQLYRITLRQKEKLENERIKERNRIAEELHDGILGKLFGARVGLGFLDIGGESDVRNRHSSYLEELRSIEREIREISHKLSENFDSDSINFPAIIERLLSNKGELGGFSFKLQFDDKIKWIEIDEFVKVNLYRIVQESVLNIIKHASAKNVSLRFALINRKLDLLVKDDGVGFDRPNIRNGIGMKNIQSRVHKMNGKFFFQSAPNEGTVINIQIPI